MISLVFVTGGIISLEKLEQMANPITKTFPQKIDELSLKTKSDIQAQLIRYYDEVLTQSARNYAFTQDKKWEERYQKIKPILDELITDTINHGDEEEKRIFDDINMAHIALVKMEYDSLELVNNGQSEVAIQILESSEYWEKKKIYQKGIEDYVVHENMVLDDTQKSSTDSIDEIIYKVTDMINFNRVIILFFIPIILGAFLVLGFFISKSFSDPMKNIILGIDHVKKGDLEFVIKKEGSEEHHKVIDAFNQMTTYIKESQITLKQQLLQIENLKSSLDNSSIVAITDKDGTITYANKKFCDISKYSKEELIGQNHCILKSGFHNAEFYQNIWKTISSGKIWQGDIKNKAKDGTFYWVRTAITPFIGKDGTAQYIAVRTDVTELYAQKDTIESQFQELKKRDRQKDEFISMISHELKSPIFPIIGYCDLLREPELSKNFNILHFEALDEITSNAERLGRITEGLLDVNRINMKKLRYNIEKFSLAKFATRIAKEHAHLMKEKQIEFYVLPVEDQIIESDEQRLMQVIGNIIRNAVDFVPNKDGKITVNIRSKSGHITFSVKDNGVGMSKENQHELFTPFYQVDSSATRKHGGTGLGLAICKGIVEDLGGKIWVESDAGKGSTFFFSVPLKSIEKKDESGDNTQEQ
ncbi:MAG: ATP-binding protein [Candidatus Nitrosopumilus sp. bin_6a]